MCIYLYSIGNQWQLVFVFATLALKIIECCVISLNLLFLSGISLISIFGLDQVCKLLLYGCYMLSIYYM